MALVGRLILVALSLGITVAILLGGARCSPGDRGPGAGGGNGSGDSADASPAPRTERIDVTIGSRTFALEPAFDDATRARGLMDRTEIDPDGGMLFVFPDVNFRSFWMKNCVSDMDILFLDGMGRITAMHEMVVEPPRQPGESLLAYESRLEGYPSIFPAQFAIELAPGTARTLGVDVGDRVDLELDRLKRRAR